jgi:hypothetical protein
VSAGRGNGCNCNCIPGLKLADTRAGGFVLTREQPAGKWAVAMYSFHVIEAATSGA